MNHKAKIGEVFGNYKIVAHTDKVMSGVHPKYIFECLSCGGRRESVTHLIKIAPNPCHNCKRAAYMPGKTVGNILVLERRGKINRTAVFKVKCLKCNYISLKSYDSVRDGNGRKCHSCTQISLTAQWKSLEPKNALHGNSN